MNTKPITKVAIYLRKSRSEEGVQDLETHKNYLINVAQRNKWSYELYEEIDSSQDINRPELQRMRKDISLGSIDAVMVHALDRLSRKQRHFLEIVEDYFLGEGMNNLYVKDTHHNLNDSTTITLLQVQATMSQAEYSFIVNRLNEGRKESAKKGIVTGKPVHGYKFDQDKRKMVVVESERPVIRRIAEMLLEGTGYKEICNTLNDLGYRTRKGRLWDIHNIKSIINSPMIRGHVHYKFKDESIEVKDSHEAIVSESEYRKIKEIMDKRSNSYKNTKMNTKHPLQGIMKCYHCGKSMVIGRSKSKRAYNEDRYIYFGEYRYYVRSCRPQVKGMPQCHTKGCKAVIIEDMLRDIVKEYSSQIYSVIDNLMELDSNTIKEDKEKEIQEIKTMISKLEGKEETWLDMVGDESAPVEQDTVFTQVNKIKQEKADKKAELKRLETEYSAINVEQEIESQKKMQSSLNKWDELPHDKKRETLQLIFKNVWYIRDSKDEPPRLKIETYNSE